MADASNIEWTDSTFNPWEGCQKVGPGCDHCYAENRNARFGGGVAVNWGPGALRRRTSVGNWHKPVQWNAAHAAFFADHGRRRRVFCASLADVFDNQVPAQWRFDLWQLIADTPNLDWLLLTKRIGNVKPMLDEIAGRAVGVGSRSDWAPQANVWLGATVVNQEEADRDIPKLLAVPARVRFLSMEPLLGPVDLALAGGLPLRAQFGIAHETIFDGTLPGIDWVIVGGESGPGARPMHPDWARGLRDQCQAAGVPFLFKQWGEWAPATATPGGDLGGELRRGTVQHLHAPGNPEGFFRPGDAYVRKVGKKAAGRLLNGRTWDGFPA